MFLNLYFQNYIQVFQAISPEIHLQRNKNIHHIYDSDFSTDFKVQFSF